MRRRPESYDLKSILRARASETLHFEVFVPQGMPVSIVLEMIVLEMIVLEMIVLEMIVLEMTVFCEETPVCETFFDLVSETASFCCFRPRLQ